MESFKIAEIVPESFDVWMDNFRGKKINDFNTLYVYIYKLSNYPFIYICSMNLYESGGVYKAPSTIGKFLWKGGADMPKSTTKQHTQTVRINGARVRLTTRNGKVTAKPAGEVEWRLQAAAVRALRAMPEFGKTFLLAGDMASGKRGPKAQMQAIATGLTPGDPDLRLYLANGAVRFIEYKTATGRLSPAQRDRHAAMAKLGHVVEVVSAFSEEECAAATVALVRGWLAANNNATTATAKSA